MLRSLKTISKLYSATHYMRIQSCSRIVQLEAKSCNGSYCLLSNQKGFKTIPSLNVVQSEQPEKPPDKKIKFILIGIFFTVAASVWWYFNTFTKKQHIKIKENVESKKLRIPLSSEDFPKEAQYLIIGGGTAAFSAFRSIKSSDPKAKVLIISNEEHLPYMRPPLSKELWHSDLENQHKYIFKQWNGSVRSIYYEPESFYTNIKELSDLEKGGVSVARGWNVSKIEPVAHRVTLDDGTVISYKKCLLATGASSKQLPVFENSPSNVKDKVFYLRTLSDFNNLNETVKKCKDIVIVGGGLLGSELACTLKKQKKNVVQIFKEEGHLTKIIPRFLSIWMKEQIEKYGVQILASSEICKVERMEDRISLTLTNGKKIETDVCIAATGAQPNVDLAKGANLEVDPHFGGFLVNAELQAVKDLFVAGDAASFYSPTTNDRIRIEHHDHAVASGRLAGENMALNKGRPYEHLAMFWSDLHEDLSFEALGRIDSKLKTHSVFPADLDGQYSKGVIFYLGEDGLIVGILLWNLFSRLPIARQVLKARQKFDDLNEVAKLFAIYFED